ncbi:radical SAM protein [Amycolatopsis solani]|uniref:radical SAM protein n=1 Tax=Amycolatopsis solani TaxID=3028615 RepID=UPI0025B2424B|nr:radical SAM protein [Amycolatopsis sp. MEP2-6]
MIRRDSKAVQALRLRPNTAQVRNAIAYRRSERGAEVANRPTWLLIYLTDNCNLRCQMCPHHTTLEVDGFKYLKIIENAMTLDVLEGALNRYPEVTHVSLTGVGEPLMHPQIMDVLAILNSRRVLFDVTSNGYLLSGEVAEALQRSQHLRELSVSLNGATPEEHYGVTGARGFNRVLENVRRITGSKRSHLRGPMRIAGSQVCTPDNVATWDTYVKLGADLKLDRLYLHNVIDMNIQGPGLTTLTDTPAVRDAIAQLPDRAGDTEIIKPRIIKKAKVGIGCQFFHRNIALDAKGAIGSCGRVMNPSPLYGNIKDEPDPWTNDYFTKTRATFVDGTMPSPCWTCVELQSEE